MYKVLYITERCVFKLNPKGLELIEVASGINIEKDILPHMEFKPIMNQIKVKKTGKNRLNSQGHGFTHFCVKFDELEKAVVKYSLAYKNHL